MDLLFLNVSNPADSKNRRNKRIVKKWASVNNQRQSGASPSPQPETNQPSTSALDDTSAKSACWVGTLSYGDGDGVADHKQVSSPKDFARPKRPKAKAGQATRATKRNAETKALSDASVDLDDSALFSNIRDVAYSPRPTGYLSASNGDPFDSLPLASNKHHDHLLYLYAQGVSRSYACIHAANCCDAPKLHTALRRQVWLPLALQSKASHSALLAYTQTSPRMHENSKSGSSAAEHLHGALNSVIEDLNDPFKESNDMTCFAVILLMIIAQRMNDLQAIEAHVRGLLLLACRRGGKLNFIVESFLDNAPAWNFCQTELDVIPPEPDPECDPYHAFGNTSPPAASRNVDRSGFTEMLRKGLLDKSTARYYRHSVLLATLGRFPDTGSDWVTINSIAAHFFLGDHLPRHSFSCFDTICICIMRTCLHGIFPSHDFNDPSLQHVIMSILRGLVQTDLDPVWAKCPQALLWIALTIGPLAQGRAREWFRGLLREAHEATSVWTAEEAVAILNDRFVIAPSMIAGAELFWMEMIFDTDNHQRSALALNVDEIDKESDVDLDAPRQPYFHPRNSHCMWRKHLEDFRQYRERRFISYLDEAT